MDSTATKEPVYPGLGIDFIVHLYSGDRRLVDVHGLDFPLEDFNAGDLRGQSAAFQLMAAAEKLPREDWDGWFETVVISAVKELERCRGEDGDADKPSRRGAAVGMLYILDQMLSAFARTGLWRSVLMEQMGIYRSMKVEEHEKEIARLDEFVSSMVAPAEAAQRSVAKKSASKPSRKAVATSA